MSRTRKWNFVKQEAQRLAALNLPAEEIAKRLDLNRSTVWRWVKAGKLPARGVVGRVADLTAAVASSVRRTPSEWAASVRAEYQLNPTDDQLVTMGESALLMAQDQSASTAARLLAMTQFRQLVAQLKLVSRAAESELERSDESEDKPKSRAAVAPVKRGIDPRSILQAVK